jgi:copper chaperone CopZ
VSRAIASVSGIEDVKVSFADQNATVKSTRCDDGVGKDISASLTKAGYGGEVVETTPAS